MNGPSTPEHVVIVGFGAGGLTTAESLRRAGWRGRLTILSDEAANPYDRPPLSKQYLTGEADAAAVQLVDEARLAQLDATIVRSVSATSLSVDERIVVDSAGTRHAYDHLVIATGVTPRAIPAVDIDGVHTLRTRDDADRLRDGLTAGSRLVVIGAGFLGLEVAASAVGLGVDVTVVEPMAEPLANRLGADIAGRLLAMHRTHGVRLLTGIGVDRILGTGPESPEPFTPSSGEPDARRPVAGVRLSDGSVVPADTVLVAIGATPATRWLDGSGLTIDNGVVCDETCLAAPGVWAVGDIARWYDTRVGAHVRLEHRMNATDQARAVAANILGAARPYRPIPFFWTDHYDVRIQFAGIIPHGLPPEVAFGDPRGPSFALTWRAEDGTLLGAANWNAVKAMIPFRQELARQSVGAAS